MAEKIYVASPMKGDIPGNLEKAKKYCRQIMYDGIPICPHLYFSTYLDDDFGPDRLKGMVMGEILLGECNWLYVFTDELTEGIIAEIKKAKELGIPIKFFDASGEIIEYDELLIKTHIGPALKRAIEDYYRPEHKKVSCPYAGNCSRKTEIKKPGTIRERFRRIFR